MRKIVLNIVAGISALLVLIAVINYLDVHFFRKSIKEYYIDESYMRPNFMAEFDKLKEKQVTEDAMRYEDEQDIDEFIAEKSKWVLAGKDISTLREEWHYRLFDFMKKKNPAKAEALFKKYLKIKNEEVESMKKLEDNFSKVKKELKEKYGDAKNSQFYKELHKQINAKKELREQTRDALMAQKQELLGDKTSKQIIELRKKFTQTIDQRLMYEFNLTENETIQANSEMFHKFYYLTF